MVRSDVPYNLDEGPSPALLKSGTDQLIGTVKMQFFGINIYNGRYQEFLDSIKNPQSATTVFTPNPEILVFAHHDHVFLDTLKKATYNVPDGNGLYVVAQMQEGVGYLRACARLLRDKKNIIQKYGELIKGSDLTRDLFLYAEATKKRILMIDNYRITEPRNSFEVRKRQIQTDLPHIMKEQFPDLDIRIFFDGEMSADAIAHYIQVNHIDYVFSCIGMRRQEEHLVEIWSYLPQTQKVLGLGVGASVDFILGLQRRAPEWVRESGFEWLYRLMLDPRGRWRRITRALLEFPRIVGSGKQNPR